MSHAMPVAGARSSEGRGRIAAPLDFRRPDRIAKSQLRSIHQLHENFVRSLASSLSAYLRTYLIARLVSVEELSCVEFLECLPVPTCVVAMGLEPLEGSAILEVNPSLVFPILELLLGGDGKALFNQQREITEVEQALIDGLLRVLLRNLREAWQFVTDIDFTIGKMERNPQQLQVMSPSEAVVAVAVEIRVGDVSGMLNIAMPSINIKMMRQKFDLQCRQSRSGAGEAEQLRNLNLIRGAALPAEVKLSGCEMSLMDLAELEAGQTLDLQIPVRSLLDLTIGGQCRYRGSMATSGQRAGFRIVEDLIDPAQTIRRNW